MYNSLPPSTGNSCAVAQEAWPPPEKPEASLEEQPLEFLCEHSATGPSVWHPIVWDEARRSFAFHLPNALGPGVTQPFFQRIKALAPWQPLMDKAKTRIARHTAWYTGNDSCNCAYTYGDDARIEDQGSKEFRQVMEELVECVFSKFPSLPKEAWPNCANLNLYSDGLEGVGWHADDELIFMGTSRDCPILSLSLGGMREFWIALKSDGNPDVKKGVVEVDLKDGDLVTLEGLTQKYCMHTVPRASPSDEMRQEARINVTFRWMRLHKHQCPYARVAETWYMLAQSEAEQSPNREDSSPGKQKPAYRGDGMKILDPSCVQSGRFSQKSHGSKHERTCVMSPLPQSARALFGEGSRKFAQEPPRPNNKTAFLQGWSAGESGAMGTIRWQACDACGHTCWGGGRPCQEYQGEWFCRCCWSGWAEAETHAASYQYQDWNYTNYPGMCSVGGFPDFPSDPSFMYSSWVG
mmetsp:Transcript_105291/g.164170  ORF Transcript_105291/g.164170 Transcript_105291/m.164170 type:complete len:465 (+) Transcript_105291:84-1478(+)